MKKEFDFSKNMKKLLNLPVTEEEELQRALRYGIKPSQLCHGMVLLMALLDAAEGGNLSAIKEIRSMLEDASSQKKEVTIIDDIPLA